MKTENKRILICSIIGGGLVFALRFAFGFYSAVLAILAMLYAYTLYGHFALTVWKDDKNNGGDESGNEPVGGDADDDNGEQFYVVNMGDGLFSVTRSKNLAKDGRPMTRLDLYKDDMDRAQQMYCKEFLCCSWDPPYGGVKGKRPTKEWWLNRAPYDFEVDEMLTKLVFGKNAYLGG